MVPVGEGQDAKMIYSQFLVVPYNNVLNWILGRPYAETLDVLASLVHLKLKYHNFHDDLVKINVSLSKADLRSTTHILEGRWRKTMEIDMATLFRQLRDMDIQPSIGKVNLHVWICIGVRPQFWL